MDPEGGTGSESKLARFIVENREAFADYPALQRVLDPPLWWQFWRWFA